MSDLKEAVLAYLDQHPKCLGEYVFAHSFRGVREPPPDWKPEGEGLSAHMQSPCSLLEPSDRNKLVTHHSGPEGEMCCDECASFVTGLLGADHGPTEATWAPALREMFRLIGWEAK